MANSINATSTNNGGIITTGDDSGVLNIQTNETTAISIDASQSVDFTNNIDAPNTFGFKNRIINGAMAIDQRNAGASVTPTGDSYTLDRFSAGLTQASKMTFQQSSTAPAGFKTSLSVTVASAPTVGSSDWFGFFQKIEGFNTADLGFGAVGASTVTLSFWVRSSVTGVYGGSLMNSAQNRSYPYTYTINAANTWEQKTVTIAGDTTGTWIGATNGTGLLLVWSLGAGSSFLGTANAWGTTNALGTTGQQNWVTNAGATFYITGVQLEKGTQATSFDFRSIGTELALCLRYYWRLLSPGSNNPFTSGNAESTTRGYVNLTLPQPMRTQPSAGFSNIAHLALRGGGTDIVCTSGALGASTSSAMATIIGGEFNTGSSTGASTGGCVKMVWNNASGWIEASAEL